MNQYFNPFKISDAIFRTSIYSNYKLFKSYQNLSRIELITLQKEKLNKILNYASKNVPHYKYLRQDEKQAQDPFELLKKFPILNKKILNSNPENFLSIEADKSKLSKLFSGGSSGNPGVVYVSNSDNSILRANILLLWENAGYQTGMPILQLGMAKKRTFLKKLKDLSLNVQYELAFQINESHVLKVLKGVNPSGNTCFIGYASGLYEYACIAEKNNLNIKFNRVISLGDKMFKHYREKIEKVFMTNVFDTYGSNEGFVIGGQHQDGSYYLNEAHVYIEIVDDQYQPVKQGEIGRVVATSLDNYSMPLIRFDLGDLISINEYSSNSKLPFKTIGQIIGRDVDIIRTKSGNSLIVHFFTAIMGRLLDFEQFRILQNSIDSIIIEYIPSSFFKEETLFMIESKILAELPPNELKVEFKEVNSIPRSGSGKPQILKSLI